MSELVTNVLAKKNPQSTFVIKPLVHIRQKEKIALKVARELPYESYKSSSLLLIGFIYQ
jgi:tRNA(Ile)-lysidine synthase TilS/MesJ